MSRIKLYLNKLVTVTMSCGSCIKPKLSNTIDPKPKSKATKPTPKQPATTQSSHCSYYESPNNMKSPESSVGGDGLAVEKDSDDPYLDFIESMLLMIVENEIYSTNDLIKLLKCFLQLNSPHLHEIIFSAFTEILEEVFSVTVRQTTASMGSKRTVNRKARHTAAKVRQARRTDRYVG